MSDVLRLAVIGCGYVAQNDYFPVLAAAEVRERVEVVAVCDTVPGRARDTADRFSFGAGYTDLDSTLTQAAPDLVAILTPIPLHFDQAVASLNAGAHVYVQKTMTSTLAQARELTRRAAELNLVLTASPGQMLDGAHQFAARAIADGSIGDVCFARGQGPHPGHENGNLNGADPAWYYQSGRWPAARHGGVPADQPGQPARTGRPGDRHQRAGAEGAVLGGTAAGAEGGRQLGAGPGLRQRGPRVGARQLRQPRVQHPPGGDLRIDRGDPARRVDQSRCACRGLPGPGPGRRESGWTRPSLPAPANDYKPTVRDLLHTVDALRTGEPPALSGLQAAHVIEVIEAARRSAAEGAPAEVHSRF